MPGGRAVRSRLTDATVAQRPRGILPGVPDRADPDRTPRVTAADVARLVGVSTASVSRALSGGAGVSDSVREQIRRAAEKLSYQPNVVARALRTTRTHTIGLIVSDVLNPFFGELASAVEEAAHRQGFSVILCNAAEDARRQDEYLELLMARQVDGLLVTPALTGSVALSAAVARSVPMVCVDRAAPGLATPVVRADGRRATRALVDHLVGLGHERIAIISGPRDTLTGRERLTAFRSAMTRHRLSLRREHVRMGDFQMASGRAAARELLDLRTPPTAIFVADNLMTVGAAAEVRDRHLRVGRDIALAGFDDPPWFALLDPPVTTVAQPVTRMGELAVGTLLEMIAGGPGTSHVLDCELLVRQSCGEPG